MSGRPFCSRSHPHLRNTHPIFQFCICISIVSSVHPPSRYIPFFGSTSKSSSLAFVERITSNQKSKNNNCLDHGKMNMKSSTLVVFVSAASLGLQSHVEGVKLNSFIWPLSACTGGVFHRFLNLLFLRDNVAVGSLNMPYGSRQNDCMGSVILARGHRCSGISWSASGDGDPPSYHSVVPHYSISDDTRSREHLLKQ